MFLETTYEINVGTFNQDELVGDVKRKLLRDSAYTIFYADLAKKEETTGQELVCFLEGPELRFDFDSGGQKQIFVKAKILWRDPDANIADQ